MYAMKEAKSDSLLFCRVKQYFPISLKKLSRRAGLSFFVLWTA